MHGIFVIFQHNLSGFWEFHHGSKVDAGLPKAYWRGSYFRILANAFAFSHNLQKIRYASIFTLISVSWVLKGNAIVIFILIQEKLCTNEHWEQQREKGRRWEGGLSKWVCHLAFPAVFSGSWKPMILIPEIIKHWQQRWTYWGGSELICLLHLQEEEELLSKRKLSNREEFTWL